MTNQRTKKDGSQTIATPGEELTDAQLAAVTGGTTRGASTGMATGKRIHKPIEFSPAAEPSSEG